MTDESTELLKDRLTGPLMDMMEGLLSATEHRTVTTDHDRSGLDGCFKFMALRASIFVQSVQIIIDDINQQRGFQRNKYTLVDAGCGVGTKLVLAAAAGFVVTGIENDPVYVKRAIELFSFHNGKRKEKSYYHRRLNVREIKQTDIVIPTILQEDIRRHDFSQYDVVYVFNPLSLGEAPFERDVQNQMKPGAYWFALDCFSRKRAPNDLGQFQHIGGAVYCKRKS